MASSSDYSQNMLEDSTNISSEKEIMTKFSEEEQSLIATVFKLLGKRWALIAGRIPGRTADEIEYYCTCFTPKTSSRNDFMNEFSKDEESLIARMFKILGERWDIIARRIPGRTAEQIKNYWTARSLPASYNY